MEFLEVNRETCRKDGICAAACPAGLIDFKKGDYPHPVAGADTECIKCGHCVAICPTGSLSLAEMTAAQCGPLQKSLGITAEQGEYLIKSRRSVRTYQDKPVSQEVLARLIEIARYAPSGKNSQCVEWLVLANKDQLQAITGIAADWMRSMINNKPEMAGLLGLPNMLKRQEGGKDEFLRNTPVLIITHAKKENPFASVACPIALAYFDLAANSMGLGCCWAGMFTRVASSYPPMMQALSLPDGHLTFASMMVGYPRFSYYRVPLRTTPRITWRF